MRIIYIYIYTTILIVICCTIVYILIDRKYKNSKPDTNPKIQRNLSSRIIGNLLQSDSSGNLSVIPAPLTDQKNYVLTGNGNWAPYTAARYCMLLITKSENSNIPLNRNITFDFQQVNSGLSFDMPTSTFVLQPACSYKLTGCLPNGINRTQPSWYNVTTDKYIGSIGSGTNDQNSSALAVAYLPCTVATTVALRSGYGTGTMGLLANTNVGQYGWATIEVVGGN
jgi:hypothetical protein